MKGTLLSVSVKFDESKTQKKISFWIYLNNKRLKYLLSLKICIWDSKNKEIKLIDNEMKLSIMNFKIKVLE